MTDLFGDKINDDVVFDIDFACVRVYEATSRVIT